MAIKFELKEKLEKVTRRLGTKVDSYLEEYFDILSDKPETETFDDFVKESERYSKSSIATQKQLSEGLLMFGLIDIKGKIIENDFSTKEDFIRIVTNNIKNVLKDVESFKQVYRNNHKLINDFIYIYGIELLKNDGKEVAEFYDKSMEKRTSELKSVNIVMDSELKKLVIDNFKILMEKCGHKIMDGGANMQDYIETQINFQNYEEDKIQNFKLRIENEVNNVFDLINMVLAKDKKIVIPFYQREYVWTKDLIENFIREIASDKNEMLNIGNILISISGDGNSREYALVDGQQRLTSIMMLFNALSKALSKIDLTSYDIDPFLLNMIRQCKNSKMIENVQNKSNGQYLDDLMEVMDIDLDDTGKFSKDKSVIKTNYEVIASFVNSLSDSSKVNMFIKLSYIFSVTTTDGLSDEIELFISTNSSRKPLSNYDLIRSYLISKVEIDVEPKEINEKINKVTNLLDFNGEGDEKTEDVFLKFYLDYMDKMYYVDTSKEKDIFRRFRNNNNVRISTNNDIILLLDQLISILESYRVIKGVDEIENIYLFDFLISLGDGLKVSSIYDIFLVYFVEELRKISDEKQRVDLLNEFRKILLVIEKFEIKWKLFTFRGDSLTNSFSNLFSLFYDSIETSIATNEYETLHSTFNEVINEDGGFISSVLNKDKNETLDSFKTSENITQQKNALKILNRVCFNLFNNGVEYKKNSKNYFSHFKPTIEHIFPRSHSKWEADDKTNSVELIPYLENIGNKFIFNKEENTSAGNKTFSDKIAHYKPNNDLKLDKTLNFEFKKIKFSLLEKEEWTSKDIELREEYIINKLLEIWK